MAKIDRKLQAQKSYDDITKELCDVQPMHNDKKVLDAFNTLWDITVNQKKTIVITFKKEDK